MRRFARILVGHQRDADDLVRHVIEGAAVSKPRLLATADNNDMAASFAELARLFNEAPFYVSGVSNHQSRLRELSCSDLDELTAPERMVFALSEVEGYDHASIALISGLNDDEVEQELETAVAVLLSQPRVALYLEPEPVIRDLVAQELADQQIVADSFGAVLEALEATEKRTYDILIAEPIADSLVDETKLLIAYAERASIPVIWTTASPWRVDRQLSSEDLVVTKPFEVGALIDVVCEAVYIAPHRWSPPDATFTWPAATVPDEELVPAAAPIDAVVVDGQLRLAASEAPDAVVPFSALDALRRQHRQQAVDLADDVRAGNASPRIQRKLDALASLLGQPLTEDMVIGLAVGIDGYARLLPIIQEEYLDLDAADMAGFVYDIQAFTNQFPVCRQFRAEAEASRPVSPDEEAALQSVVTVLIEQPDTLVDPALKRQFETLQSARAVQAGSSIGDVGWLRSVSNALKAVARQVKTFGVEVIADARGVAVKGVSRLIVTLPVGMALQFLSVSHPVEFAAVTLLLTQSREQITKLTGKTEEDKDDD